MVKMNSKQLRAVDAKTVSADAQAINRNPMIFILENIYDTYNIGGIFRLADALGVTKLYLCGETETPPNNRIHKASCGTYKVVPWEYCKTVKEAIHKCKENGEWQIVAVEQSPTSIPYTSLQPKFPLALIVGNETTGVTPGALTLCDKTVEIPMWGINKSLNVIVSAAIVSYHLITHRKA